MFNPRSLIAIITATVAVIPLLPFYAKAQDGAFGPTGRGAATFMEEGFGKPTTAIQPEDLGTGYRNNRIVLPPDIYRNLESAPDSFRQFNEYILLGREVPGNVLELPKQEPKSSDILLEIGNVQQTLNPADYTQKLESFVSGLGENGLLVPKQWSTGLGANSLTSNNIALAEQLKQVSDYGLTPGGMPSPYRSFLSMDGWTLIYLGDPAAPVPITYVPPPTSGGYTPPTLHASMEDAKSGRPARCNGVLSASLAQDVSGLLSFANCMEPKSFPTAVALRASNSRVMCSGVLVGQSHIATAAHCFCGNEQPYSVFFGERGWSSITPGLKSGLRTEYLVGNPEFADPQFCTNRQTHDIAKEAGEESVYPSKDLAVVRILTSLDPALANSIFPLEKLWSPDAGGSIEVAWIVGYGVRESTERIGEKIYANQRLDADACSIRDECHEGEEFVATGTNENKKSDSCFGDSGGPIYLDLKTDDANNPRQRVLAGIVSRGTQDNNENACGKGGIYTDLRNDALRKWMTDITNNP